MARMLLPISAVLSTVIFGIDGHSNENIHFLDNKPFLSDIRSIDIHINDQVKDGCMPTPKSIIEAVESEILRSGVSIFDKSMHYMYINAVGFSLEYRDGTSTYSCSVYVSLHLRTPVVARVPNEPNNSAVLYTDLSVRGRLLVATKNEMQNMIRNAVIENANSIMLELIKARSAIGDSSK